MPMQLGSQNKIYAHLSNPGYCNTHILPLVSGTKASDICTLDYPYWGLVGNNNLGALGPCNAEYREEGPLLSVFLMSPENICS